MPSLVRAIIPLVIVTTLMGLVVQGLQGTEIRRLLGDDYSILFYRELDPELLDDYGDVFGIAHNAGNRYVTIRRALEHGADGIEADVTVIDGRLYAAHDAVPVWIGAPSTRPIPLDAMWEETEDVDLLKLDLKSTWPEALDRIYVWLAARQGERPIAVSSRNPTVLSEIAERFPDIVRLLSIGNIVELEALQNDPELVEMIHGVTISERLVDREVVKWLNDQELFIGVWTVNTVARLNELVRWGVHAVTTDNLAILELLSSHEEDGLSLSEAVGTPATEEP